MQTLPQVLALVANTHDRDHMNNKPLTTARQGPMTAHQLREVLANATNSARDRSMAWGTKDTSGRYYRAWVWLTAKALGMGAIPHRGPWEPWELEDITATIRKVQDLVALQDPC